MKQPTVFSFRDTTDTVLANHVTAKSRGHHRSLKTICLPIGQITISTFSCKQQRIVGCLDDQS